MRILVSIVAVVSMLLGVGAALAEDNPLIGRWLAKDAGGSGETLTFTFTATHMEMAGEQPLPYRAERQADTITVFVEGKGNPPPAVFTLVGQNEMRMHFSGGPGISMTRAEVSPATQPAIASGDGSALGTLMDEISSAMLPHGVPTRFESLGQSLEQLLGGGWKLEQLSGAQGGFTVWLTRGGINAVCIVAPKLLDQSGGALSDCRRLN